MKSEADVKKEVKKILAKLGITRTGLPNGYYFMPNAGAYGRAGIHDFIGSVGGRCRFFSIETKFGKNKMTELQIVEAKAVEASGGLFFEVNETNVGTLLGCFLSYLEEIGVVKPFPDDLT